MIRAAHQLQKERGRRKNLSDEIENKEKKIMEFRANLDLLRTRSENLKKTTVSADERTKHLEKLIDYEQKQQRASQIDVEMLQNNYFRVQHELQVQFNVGKMKDLDIYGVTNNINHLRKHNEDQRKALAKRKEDAYELDYKIDEVQRKILINENVIHNEDTEVLEARLIELENKMGEHAEVCSGVISLNDCSI
jgi:chromosome segregation ATPase